MGAVLRSKQGCWTCRLRKKKCDETRPQCTTCDSLSIPCYGFGTRPDWMNDSEKERAVASSLKDIVKSTSRHRAGNHTSKQGSTLAHLAPKTSGVPLEENTHGTGAPKTVLDAVQAVEISGTEDGSISPSIPISDDWPEDRSISSIPPEQFIFIMNFLDNVLPLQYPTYNPLAVEGGRGWLLALLLKSEPLYYSVLALSAYHHRIITLSESNQEQRLAAFLHQERYLETSLELVNRFARNSCPRSGLGVTIAIVQLSYLELFTGHDTSWKPHLRAAMNMYQRSHQNGLGYFGLSEEAISILSEDLALSNRSPAIIEEVASFRFLGATLTWLDIVSSITTGSAPHLLPYDSQILSSKQMKLENIVGCKNWVLLQIGLIAALHAQRTSAEGVVHKSHSELTEADITRELQSRFTKCAFQSFNFSETADSTEINSFHDTHEIITQLYAYMAIIYLHLVVHGFEDMAILESTISSAMSILRYAFTARLFSSWVCPLFIIGTVAKQADEAFFRTVLSSAPLSNPVLQHRSNLLPILEDVWYKRRISSGFSWRDVVSSVNDILLV